MTTGEALSLLTFYGGWGRYQQSFAAIIAPLTPAQLDWQVSPGRTIAAVARHMVANRVWWFQVWMGEGSPDLAPIAHWDPADPSEKPALDAAALVAGAEATWQMIAASLARWTPADLDRVFSPPARMSETERRAVGERTRGWIIWHVFQHEVHHGGEISLVLGQHGLSGIYGDL